MTRNIMIIKGMALGLIAIICQTAIAQSGTVWYKPGALPEQNKIDRDYCYLRHGRNESGGMGCMRELGWTLVERARVEASRKECREKYPNPKGSLDIVNQYHDCMKSQGWEDEPIISRQLRELSIASRNVCQRPEYETINKVMPCRVAEINIEHMANSEKINLENKQVFLNYFKELDEIREKTLQRMRAGGIKEKKIYEYRISISDNKVDEARINFINGKTTIGEFNRKRKENEADFQKMVMKIEEEVRSFINSPSPQGR